MTILVLGGYGTTGKILCKYLLQETDVDLIVAGRSFDKAEKLVRQLQKEFRGREVYALYADAADPNSLKAAFGHCNMVIVASSTPKWAGQIAREAINSRIDYLDIYYDQKTYPELQSLSDKVLEHKLCFVTQAGFHPGLPSVYIRKGSTYFDNYEKAIIAFTMNVKVESIQSVQEIISSIPDHDSRIYKNGQWEKSTYKDFIQIDYGGDFGTKTSIPMFLKEIEKLPDELGLLETGIFTTGFNWFTDWIVFPLATISNKIYKGFLNQVWAKLLAFGINHFSSSYQGVTFMLIAEGTKNGVPRKLIIRSFHEDPYVFTVLPVIAYVKQYLNGITCKKGLWLMGHLVDPDLLIAEINRLGVTTTIQAID